MYPGLRYDDCVLAESRLVQLRADADRRRFVAEVVTARGSTAHRGTKSRRMNALVTRIACWVLTARRGAHAEECSRAPVRPEIAR